MDSILRQDYPDFEIIIADDASTDGTETIDWQRRDPRIQYIRLPVRSGAQAARNAGLALARGELVCFLDSDDLMLPHSLAVRCRYYQDHPECESSYSDYEVSFSGMQDRLIKRIRLGGAEPAALYRRVLTDLKLAPVIVVMARRMVLLEAGGWDESLPASHDDDLYIRLTRRGRCQYIPVFAARIVHLPGDSITCNRYVMAAGKALLVEKHRAQILENVGSTVLQRHYLSLAYDYFSARHRPEARSMWKHARQAGPLRFSVIIRVLSRHVLFSGLRMARRFLYRPILAIPPRHPLPEVPDFIRQTADHPE